MYFDFKSSPILLKDSHTQEKAENDKTKRRREKEETNESERDHYLRKRDSSSNTLRSSTPPEMRFDV
jgi:hypothetical protein